MPAGICATIISTTPTLGFNIAPAQLQSFLHPFADIPHYLMVKADYPSWLIACVLALPVALTLYFLGQLSQVARISAKPFYIVLPILLIAGTGASGFPVIGSTMSEWHVTALFIDLLSQWLSCRYCCWLETHRCRLCSRFRCDVLVHARLTSTAHSSNSLLRSGRPNWFCVGLFAVGT